MGVWSIVSFIRKPSLPSIVLNLKKSILAHGHVVARSPDKDGKIDGWAVQFTPWVRH